MDNVRREVTDLQRRLGKVEDQREDLEEGALAVFRVVAPRMPMRVDQLHTLPEIIRTGMHLGGIDPGFPETSSAAVVGQPC